MTTPAAYISNDELIGYAEEMIVQAIRTGFVNPALALECVYYAAEPDLVAALRIFAGLDNAARIQLMNYARALAGQDADVMAEERSAPH